MRGRAVGRNTHALATGLFLLILTSALVVAVYWIGNLERVRNTYVISTSGSVSGLNPDSTVYYRGIAVGKVVKVYFDSNNPQIILIPIEVDKEIEFTRGLYATLQLKGVTGLTQINLQDAGNNSELLPPGDHPDSRIPLLPSLTDRLMNTGQDILAKAEVLMDKIDHFLSDKNEKEGVSILRNLNIVSGKLIDIENQLYSALEGVPALTVQAGNTLKRLDTLTEELKGLASEAKKLTGKTTDFASAGAQAGNVLTETTLPRINDMIMSLQKTIQQVNKVAGMLQNRPQALIWGPEQNEPGPGEPGYEASK